IRWKILGRDLSGKWGRLYLPENMPGGSDQNIQEPTLKFGNHRPIMLAGRKRRGIKLSQSLGLRLRESLDELGTVTVDEKHICDISSRFPATINYQTNISTEHLNKSWWESDRHLMWYAPRKSWVQNSPSQIMKLIEQLDMYGYQIENDELIHRTEEFPSDDAVNELKELFHNQIQSAQKDVSREHQR